MFVSLWVPPPVWLNCPSPTLIIIIYHTLTTARFISVCTAAGCLYYLYMFILTLFPVRLLLLVYFRICILSQYKIFILILFSVEFFEIIWLIFEKSLFLSYILRSHTNERPDSSNNLRKRYFVHITEM